MADALLLALYFWRMSHDSDLSAAPPLTLERALLILRSLAATGALQHPQFPSAVALIDVAMGAQLSTIAEQRARIIALEDRVDDLLLHRDSRDDGSEAMLERGYDAGRMRDLLAAVLDAPIRPARSSLEPDGGWQVWASRARVALGRNGDGDGA